MTDERFERDEPLTADRLNRLASASRQRTVVPGGAGSDGMVTADGVVHAPRPRQEFWIRLTGGGAGGVYAWVEQIPDDAGTWVDGSRSGTTLEDPAVEVNQTPGLAIEESVRAWAWRVPGSRRLHFQMGRCS